MGADRAGDGSAEPSGHYQARADRFRPTRAGIINLWDYRDEEFVFADGRLVLRGPNGSGKTKALEVLFPFVLDGRIEPRRLNPFAGEERTMKSNLLYRGQESAYGYAWMEFATPTGGAVTVGVGLRAQRHNDRVVRWYFVTDGRVGVDFSLLAPDDRPLTQRQLKDEIGADAVTDKPAEHRARIDGRLFGLGAERYEQLLTLVLTLRRPQLAKNLDPKGLSQALTDGLRPLDDELITEAAHSFGDMESVQRTLANLVAADDAARAFLADYTTYLRAHARAAADAVNVRLRQVAQAREVLVARISAQLESARRRADAEQADRRANQSRAQLAARLDSLKASAGYGHREQLRRQAELVADLAAAAEKAVRDADQAAVDLARRRDQLAIAQREAHDATAAVSRIAEALGGAARDAGIAWGAEDLHHDDELGTRARSRAQERSADVGIVRVALDELQRCRAARDRAEESLERAAAAATDAEIGAAACEEELAAAREAARESLRRWAIRNEVTLEAIESDAVAGTAVEGDRDPDRGDAGQSARHDTGGGNHDAKAHHDTGLRGDSTAADHDTDGRDDGASGVLPALTAQVDLVGAPTGTSLPARFDELATPALQRRQSAIATWREQRRGVEAELRALRAQRSSIEAEKDDAPTAFPARTDAREGRSGAALWRLVRFADTVTDAQAAGIEAGLHAANLLDAWVDPNDEAPIGESETVLRPLPEALRPAGPTLAEVLVPEDGAGVPTNRVISLLRSIELDDAWRVGEPGVAPRISSDGRFAAGLQAGAHTKPTAEYIGATARARRRAERLAALDVRIAQAQQAADGLAGSIDAAAGLLEAIAAARADLPATAPIVAAVSAAHQAAGELRARRSTADAAGAEYDQAQAEVAAAAGNLRRTAADRNLPSDTAALDAVAAAVEQFQSLAGDLVAARSTAEDRAQRQRSAHAELESAADTATQRQTEAERARTGQQQRETELATLRDAVGASADRVDADITAVQRELRQATADRESAAEALLAAAEAGSAAESARAAAAERLAATLVECRSDAGRLAPFAAPEIQALLRTGPVIAWPAAAEAWPDPAEIAARATQELVDDAHAAVDVLPAPVTALHAAIGTVTDDLRPTESSLKSSSTRVSTALTDLQNRLSAAGHDYRPEWDSPDGVIVVKVADEQGYAPIGAFAERIAAARHDQEQLLTESEQRILEDALLGRLAQQIHERTTDARDLIGRMSREMRTRRMSSGATIGVRWELADTLDAEQRSICALLDRDAAHLDGDDLVRMRGHFAGRIKTLRAARPDRPYTEILAEALDYRRWRAFAFTLTSAAGSEARLTQARHSTLSGGEQSVSLHLPLFAAAHVMLSSARPESPRLVAMDEAFAGIDDAGRGELLGLTTDFDIDLFMTGHDLWATYACVPACAHYDLSHSAIENTVSALLLVWNGAGVVADGPSADLAAALGSPGRRRRIVLDEPTLDAETDLEPAP